MLKISLKYWPFISRKIELGILSYLFGYPKLDISPLIESIMFFFGRKYVMLGMLEQENLGL